MLVVSDQSFEALARRHGGDVHARFAAWWNMRAGWLGQADAATLHAAYDALAPEADLAGLDAESDVFHYVCGKMLMPGATGDLYEALLNIVCEHRIDDGEKLRRLLGLAQAVRGA